MDKKNFELAAQLRHELHAHPELSYRESWTQKHLMEFLRANTKNLKIVDKGRWFYAVYEAGLDKPSIAFRADFDALPISESCCDFPWKSQVEGVSHKCGHDGHSASLAGFALEVDQKGSDKNVFFLFQHAEETGQGAFECCEMFRENRIDEVYAAHCMQDYPLGSIITIDGTCNDATTGMIMKFTGKKSHASQPEYGINPAYAISTLVNELGNITAPEKYERNVLCTVIEIKVGEKAFGTSAGYGELNLTIRGDLESDMNKLMDGILDRARELADEWKLGFEYSLVETFPQTFNAKIAIDKVRAAARKLGNTIVERERPSRGGEDFGYYQKLVPGALYHVGCGEGYPAVHTEQFDYPDAIIPVSVDMFRAILDEKM